MFCIEEVNLYERIEICIRGMFNKERIAKLKKGVLIVNNARGAIMDAQAVADACASGHIAGNTPHPSSLSICDVWTLE